jgi:protein SCO1/2
MLCTQVLNNLTQSLKALPWTAGKEFAVLTISINPLETAELAKAKKATYLRELGRPEAAAGYRIFDKRQPSLLSKKTSAQA